MFSKIASYCGTPLYANSATSEMVRLSFARLYSEVEAAKVLNDEEQKELWQKNVVEGKLNENALRAEDVEERNEIVDQIVDNYGA
ncbi:hypothetical protein LIER_29291 [Lithospermum erythrorhizon]|uniref:Uncharacterized protein n=1 Tax=Lithospermum erythrorhizon TaxID=34254 RepID=A0AAV3RLY7_LITER